MSATLYFDGRSWSGTLRVKCDKKKGFSDKKVQYKNLVLWAKMPEFNFDAHMNKNYACVYHPEDKYKNQFNVRYINLYK